MGNPHIKTGELNQRKSTVLFLFSFYILSVNGQTPSCSVGNCMYYATMVAQTSSQLFTSFGNIFFQICDCTRYGVTLPNTSTTSPIQIQDCGISTITGSASSYLRSGTARVVGGLDASECEYPWTAFVKAGTYNCGGTLIDDRHVITAAHCLQSGDYMFPASSITVGLGSSKRSSLVYYSVAAVTRHPNYYPSTFGYDMAVLTLQTPLPNNNNCIKPACLPSSSLNLAVDTPCLVVGWGALAENGNRPDNLQEAVIPILDSNICTQAYGASLMTSNKICAGYAAGRIDSCQGDSGGPLLCADGDSWVLAGIVSFGQGCARTGFPGVYTHVSNLKSWIDSIIR